jgi:4-amino-4-deoxy-L-arabinose transferase-like glycosyltransferase
LKALLQSSTTWLRPARLVGIAIAAACVLEFTGISTDKFWDDEANTAIFAQNLLAKGSLNAWNGTNLIGYRDGAELDETLDNVFMPPLQYWIAALGNAVLGDDELGLRAPFAVLGLLCIAALALLARGLFGDEFPWWLPACLVALSPAFLLYMRNCRYYAPSACLTIVLLACTFGRIEDRRNLVARASVALVCSALLMLTNYFNAVAALCSLPFALLFPESRTRRNAIVGSIAWAAAGAVGVYVLIAANPFLRPVPRPEETHGIARIATLAWWNLRDLGTFEFMPVTLLPALALPFCVRRLSHLRGVARRGLAILGMVLAAVAVTVAFSPQSVSRSEIADMRYLVPVIPLGALATAAALRIAWELARPLGLALACLAVFSNIPHLGFLGATNSYLPPKGIQCTLCLYAEEIVTDRTTATEALIDYISKVPEDEVLLIFPPFMGYSPMYYLPERKFCCQLRRNHPLTDELRAELPDYLFWDAPRIDRALINARMPKAPEGPLSIRGISLGHYKFVERLDVPARDSSRPEIPWHAFPGEDIRAWPYFQFFVVTVKR